MKVKDLIKELSALDPNALVILQKDSEGNGFSPLEGVDENALYDAENSWSGDVGFEVLTDELRKQGYSDEDLGKGERAVVLFPIN